MAGWRLTQQELQETIGSKKKEKGPMGHAMITPNPLLPPDYFAQKGLDPFLVDLNKDLEYSLLNCPGKYTVQVATFKGQVFINPKEIEDVQKGKKKITDGLVESRQQGHAADASPADERLRGLRISRSQREHRDGGKLQFGRHALARRADRTRSENSDDHEDLRRDAESKNKSTIRIDALNTELKSLVGINFDIQPMPVLVPKASISTSMNRGHAEQNRIDFRE